MQVTLNSLLGAVSRAACLLSRKLRLGQFDFGSTYRGFGEGLLKVFALVSFALVSTVPLRAETVHESVKGYDLSLNMPEGYSDMHAAKGEGIFYRSSDQSVTVIFLSLASTLQVAMDAWTDPETVKGYLNDKTGFVKNHVQDKNNVDFYARLVMASACQGRCVVKVAIMNNGSVKAEAEAERIFERYKADFVARTFEPAGTSSRDSQSTAAQGHWFVIAGAWADNQKVQARMTLLSRNGISAHVISTDDYANLTPGLRAVVLGPTSKDQAQAQLDTVQSVVADAFIKEGD